MMIINKTRKTVIAQDSHYCNNILSQGTGLMFRSSEAVDDIGWVFPFKSARREAITMWFVFFPIDILFLDEKLMVVEIKKNLRPWQFYIPKSSFRYVLELKKGTIDKSRTMSGDYLHLSSSHSKKRNC